MNRSSGHRDMVSTLNRLHNKLKIARAAWRFREFTIKLLQIRAVERWTMYLAPTKFYKNPGLPRDITVRVTERCFLKCKFCGQGGESGRVDRKNLKSGDVTRETWQKIIDEIAEWPIKPFVKITGGEPLVMGLQLMDAIAEMHRRGIIVKLNTNGMLLKNPKMAKRVVDAGVKYLSISLDGGKEVQNELRGNPRLFDAMMEGIDNVLAYRKEKGLRYPMVLLSMIVSSETQDQIEDVHRIATERGVDWLNIQYLNYQTPESSEAAHEYVSNSFGIEDRPWDGFCNPRFNEIDPDFVARQLDNILSKRSSVPISVMGDLRMRDQIAEYYFTRLPIRRNICLIPFTGVHIVPPGKAVFCNDYPYYKYADIREVSLKDAWYGEKAMDFRKKMVAYYKGHDENLPMCARCNWRFN